jgi:hypothetical protein
MSGLSGINEKMTSARKFFPDRRLEFEGRSPKTC